MTRSIAFGFCFLFACTRSVEVKKTAQLGASPIAAGKVSLGAIATVSATITNHGTAAATAITHQLTGSADFAYAGSYPGVGGSCGNALAVGSKCTVVLNFAPSASADQQALLSLGYNDGSKAASLAIALTGTGTSAPAGGTGQSVDSLGHVPVNLLQPNGVFFSAPLTANKSAADDAITIVALGDDPQGQLVVDQITDPNGVLVEDRIDTSYVDFNFYYPKEQNRSAATFGAQAVLIPQTPDYAAPSGAYTFVVNSLETMNADVYVVHQLAATAAVPEASHVSVNLFFTQLGETAADAATNPTFQAMLARALKFLGSTDGSPPADGTLGLSIDAVHYIDVSSDYASIAGNESETSPPAKSLNELFAQSAGQAPGLNVFFVSNLSLGSTNIAVIGVDPAVPSPGAFVGTGRSGALVVMPAVPAATDTSTINMLSQAIAHELGHYLGLFHNQESTCMPDNLSDTPCDPLCTCTPDASSTCTQYVGPDLAACDNGSGAANNVMYWLLSPSNTLTFTAEQAATAKRNPLVHQAAIQ